MFEVDPRQRLVCSYTLITEVEIEGLMIPYLVQVIKQYIAAAGSM
jgi:hypothetical protein